MIDYFYLSPPPQLKILKDACQFNGPAYVKLIENTSHPPNSFVWTFRAHLIKFRSFLLSTQALTYIVRTQNHSIPSHIKLKIEVFSIVFLGPLSSSALTQSKDSSPS
jgi:hypothetical protein